MNEEIERIAEAIYDAHIERAIEQRRPSRFIEYAGESEGVTAYESVMYVNLPMADKANFYELATMTMAAWEKLI